MTSVSATSTTPGTGAVPPGASLPGDSPPLRGTRGQVFDLEPPPTGTRSRVPEIALGVLLIAGFGLGGLWWQTLASDPDPVIALAVDVERGQVIELDDLQLVQIRSDDTLHVLGGNDSGQVVGRVAVADMAAGTLLTSDHVVAATEVAAGTGVVGLALSDGQYPSLGMRAGDVVAVVLTPGASELAEVDGQVLAERAVVVEVAQIGSQGQVFTSLSMSESEAVLVARAAAMNRVWLVQVAGSDGS